VNKHVRQDRQCFPWLHATITVHEWDDLRKPCLKASPNRPETRGLSGTTYQDSRKYVLTRAVVPASSEPTLDDRSVHARSYDFYVLTNSPTSWNASAGNQATVHVKESFGLTLKKRCDGNASKVNGATSRRNTIYLYEYQCYTKPSQKNRIPTRGSDSLTNSVFCQAFSVKSA
jgi:hypothetical protein